VVKKLTLAACVLLGLSGCGIDAAVFDKITGSDFDKPPGAGSNSITGKVTLLGPGATVQFLSPTGTPIEELSTATGADGSFEVQVAASTAYVNLVVSVTDATRGVWGLVPQVDKKETVYDEDREFAMGDALPVMGDLGIDSTFSMLLLLGKARYGLPPVSLATIDPSQMTDIMDKVQALLDEEDERVVPLRAMVERFFADGATTAPPLRPFPADTESYLAIEALAPGLDYDGDEIADTSTDAFDEALATAVGALDFDVCFPDDRIRVVMMVDFRDGLLDGNCAAINKWKWTDDEAGRSMFIVGGIHPTTPNCETDEPPCLTAAEFDAASEKLGKWVPNTIPMYDDGTNGDLVAGDNIWTLALELPWWDAGAPDARWVRIHYKYTWGNQGQLWTSTEEWPGNSRLLELRDVSGDRIITRYDHYGDETTNKDNSNLRAPAKGGCGKVVFESEGPKEGCANDSVEAMIDTDGDCVLDAWPTPGTATPLTIECPEDGTE
jgi:hypothetical protein